MLVTAKLKDGTVEVFETDYTRRDWSELVDDLKSKSLLGSASPFGDVKFVSTSGREFTFSDVADILAGA